MVAVRLGRFGAHPVAVWVVKHVVSPLDRLLVRISGGRIPPLSRLAVPTLLLTAVGHRSGLERTIPLVYVRDGNRLVVANARPAGERPNPWVANLRAAGTARVRLGTDEFEVSARELDDQDVDIWWHQLVEVWPAFDVHYTATGERSVFVLEPM